MARNSIIMMLVIFVAVALGIFAIASNNLGSVAIEFGEGATNVATNIGKVADANYHIATAEAAGYAGITDATLLSTQPQDCDYTYGYPSGTPTPVPAATQGEVNSVLNQCTSSGGGADCWCDGSLPCSSYNTAAPTPVPTATPSAIVGWSCRLQTAGQHAHEVHTDATLTGTGETGTPLGVAVPLPAASAGDEGKLLGVVSGQWAKTEQVKSDWNANSGAGEILNKPTIPDAEQIRINEFIDSDGVVTFTDYDLVASYSSGNGEILFTEGTQQNPPVYFDITAVGKTGTDHRAFLDALAIGDEFVVHNTASTPNMFVFGTITDKRRQDAQGNFGATLANTALFFFTYTIDAERGLDDDNQIGTGAARVHLRQKLMQRDMDNMDTPTAGAVTKLQNALAMGFATRTLANLTSITSSGGEKIVEAMEALNSTYRTRLRRFIQGHEEAVSMTLTRVSMIPSSAGQIRLPSNDGGGGNVLVYWPTTDTDGATVVPADLLAYQHGDYFDWGSEQFTITSNGITVWSGNVYQFGISGYSVSEAPAVSSSGTFTLEGRDIHLGNTLKQILKRNSPNIGGKGGTQGNVWTRGSSDSNAGWAAIPAQTYPKILAEHTNITSTASSVHTCASNTLIIEIFGWETGGDKRNASSWRGECGDIPASGGGMRLPLADNAYFEVSRSTLTLSAKISANVNSANKLEVWQAR